MAATLRTVRLTLPRPLLEKLAAQAKVEKRTVSTVIIRAVQADLRTGKHVGRRPQ